MVDGREEAGLEGVHPWLGAQYGGCERGPQVAFLGSGRPPRVLRASARDTGLIKMQVQLCLVELHDVSPDL